MSAAARKVKRENKAGGVKKDLLKHSWQAAGLLVLLLAVFFRKILLGDAFLWEDFIYQYYPTRVFAAASMAGGAIPFWNPYTFGGMPFLADIQNTVLYAPYLLFPLVANSSIFLFAVEYSVVGHYLLAGWGAYLLARHLELNRFPSVVAASAFMLSGFLVTHAIHMTFISTASWLPLAAWLLLRLTQRRQWRCVPPLALVLGLSIFAGSPQIFYFVFLFVGGLFLFELVRAMREGGAWRRTAGKLLVLFAAAAVLGIGLAAVQLLPTMELAPQTYRAAITFEKSAEGSIRWAQLFTAIVPKLFGVSNAAGFHYLGPEPYFQYWETCFYLGIPTLLLAAAGIASLRGKPAFSFLFGTVVVTLLIALGSNFFLHEVLFAVLPGYSKFRDPARIVLLYSLAMSLLAGLGAQTLLHGEEHRRRRAALVASLTAGVFLVVLILINAGAFADALPFLTNIHVAAVVEAEVTKAIVLTVLGGVLCIFGMRAGTPALLVVPALLLLWFVDIYLFGAEQNTGTIDPRAYFASSAPLVRQLQKEGTKELFRLNSRDRNYMLTDRNQGMVDRVFLLEGYTPLALVNVAPPETSAEASLDLQNVKYRIQLDNARQQMSMMERTTYMPRAYWVGNIRSCRNLDEAAAALADNPRAYRTGAVVEGEVPFAQQPTTQPAVPFHFASYRQNSMEGTIDAPSQGVVVFSEVFYPGWTATVDGVEQGIVRTNGSQRGVFVGPGHHEIRLQFLPMSFLIGGAITLVCLVVCGGLWFGGTRGIPVEA